MFENFWRHFCVDVIYKDDSYLWSNEELKLKLKTSKWTMVIILNETPPSYPTAFGLNSNKWPLLHDHNHNFKPNFVRRDSDEVFWAEMTAFYTSLALLELLWDLKREMIFRSDRSRDPPSHVSSADFSEMKWFVYPAHLFVWISRNFFKCKFSSSRRSDFFRE